MWFCSHCVLWDWVPGSGDDEGLREGRAQKREYTFTWISLQRRAQTHQRFVKPVYRYKTIPDSVHKS